MNLIVCADEKWGIGKNGRLLARVPGDLRFFKEKTTGGVLIMGRATLESLPGGRPLPDRKTLLLTRNKDYETECRKFLSVADVLREIEKYDSERVFVAGGADVYRQLMKYCDTFYVTKLEGDFGADRFIPNLDSEPDIRLVETSGPREENGITYRFTTYVREE